MGGETSAEAIVRHLHELKATLELVGYVTTIGEPHYLTVVNPEVSRLSEMINCRRHHADDEQLWFFYSFGEPICPARDIETAAKEIGRVIATR